MSEENFPSKGETTLTKSGTVDSMFRVNKEN